ncbi:MAG: hypothetical protein IH897_01285 [Planctomycetes bacterium]|nr:hypothetical protein [Planctomycetota bacterium]
MMKENEQLERIESALLELDHAERASVFSRTPVSAEELIAPSHTNQPMVLSRHTLVWLSSVAAVVVLAAGVWTVMFKYQLDHLRSSAGMVEGPASDAGGHDPCDGNFLNCFSGPESVVLAMRCDLHDYDADGDVDLADFRNYQINCNRPPSLTR